MSATISFADNACPSCFRPPNAGGVHNHGCKLSRVRYCVLCESIHQYGDDVHHGRNGVCSQGATLNRLVKECPGWSTDKCKEHLDQLVKDRDTEVAVVEWLRANQTHRDVVVAAVRGLAFSR